MTRTLNTEHGKARIERITDNFAQISFDTRPVRQWFTLTRGFGTWTLNRAQGMDRPPKTWEGFTSQKDAAYRAAKILATEEAQRAYDDAS